MKKKILAFLLALCLLASLLPVIANAASNDKVYVQLPTDKGNGEYKALPLTFTEGASYYFLCTEEGLLTDDDASKDNYNVKIEYAKGGTPTMYLKDAYIRTEEYNAIQIGSTSSSNEIIDFDFTIYVETDSTVIGGSNLEENKYYCAIENDATGLFTITGPGKFTVTGEQTTAICAGGELLIKDITIDIRNDMTRTGVRPAIHSYGQGNVIFDNAVANIYCNIGPCIWVYNSYYEMLDNDNERDAIIRNGSIVTMQNDNDAKGTVGASGDFIIDSSEVEITSTSACFNTKPTMTGVYAVGGDKKSSAKEYKASKAKSYSYFKSNIGEAPTTEPTTVPTEPETEPTTEPTTAPTTAPTNPPATQPTNPPATKPTTPATQPTNPAPQPTTPATQPGTSDKQGLDLDMNTMILIVCLTVIIVSGIAGAVIIVKSKNRVEE